MNAYMRGFVILFVLLVLLSYLPPGKQYRKYIRFYSAASDGACSIETAVCTVWRKRYVL